MDLPYLRQAGSRADAGSRRAGPPGADLARREAGRASSVAAAQAARARARASAASRQAAWLLCAKAMRPSSDRAAASASAPAPASA